MAEKEPGRVVGIPIRGIFLIFLGVVFLLQTLNVLPWALWGGLWRFWPVLIIILGLGILLRHLNVWLVSLLILCLLGACLGIAIWQYEASVPAIPAGPTTNSYSEPLDGLEQAQIDVDFTAGSLTISSLPSSSPNFVEANSKVSNGGGSVRRDFHHQGSEGRLHLSTEGVKRQSWFSGEDWLRWEVKFTRNIPLTIDIGSAASDMNISLDELEVTELRLDIDAGNCKVKMPSSAGITYGYIDVAVANLEVTIPDGVAAKFKTDVSMGNLQIDESRFPKNGNYYMSRDFESAKNRVELEIDCDVGRVQVE
ncbi:LiaI-LiaF-like domain-containing protein [Chloroflexota bacterium]